MEELKNCQPAADETNSVMQDYIVVKALEDGITIRGLTRGSKTTFHHTEKLDAGEVYIAQFTQTTSAIKLGGKAVLYTKFGKIEVGK